MNNANIGLPGRAGNSATVWMASASVALLLFGANYLASKYSAEREAWARGLVIDIEVRSQQLAVQARDAVDGGQPAFERLKETHAAIEADVTDLQEGKGTYSGFRISVGVGAPLRMLADVWVPIGADADLILRNRDQELAFAQSAEKFDSLIEPMKARMDEVARAMADANAQASQLLLAMRQINLADTLGHRVAMLRAGEQAEDDGAHNDGFLRESRLFGQVLKGFHDGDSSLGIAKLDRASEFEALDKVSKLYADTQAPLAILLKSAAQVSETRNAERQISDSSAQLLAASQDLLKAFDTLSLHRIFPSPYIAMASGLLLLFGLLNVASASRTAMQASMQQPNRR